MGDLRWKTRASTQQDNKIARNPEQKKKEDLIRI